MVVGSVRQAFQTFAVPGISLGQVVATCFDGHAILLRNRAIRWAKNNHGLHP